MSAPLPPRPKSDTPEAKEPANQYLSEKTLQEQQAGKDALKLTKQRFQEEQEAGRKAVETNQQRARQR
jgi:hypothetical protein